MTSICNFFEPDKLCLNGTDCIIDCSESNECENYIIFANNATSMTVNCGNFSCRYSTIYCPYNECNIICSGSNSCENVYIYNDGTYNSNIECSGFNSCKYMTILGDNAGNIRLNCIGNYSNYFDAGCFLTYLYGTNAKLISLLCIGDYSCSSSYIYGDNAKNITMDSFGGYSLYEVTIYAENSSYLFLSCKTYSGARGIKYGCENPKIYIPQNAKTDLNCIGGGCHDMDFYTKNMNGINNIKNVSIYGCDECISPESCIGFWTIHCGNNYQTKTLFSGSSCSSNNCNCNYLNNKIGDLWIYGIDTKTNDEFCTANFTADIECIANSPCYINCGINSCSNKTIYGHDAISLIIDCPNDYNCQNTKIYLPNTNNALCSINCYGSYSCQYMIIYGNTGNNIYINATKFFAFGYGEIYGYYSNQVTLNCLRDAACVYSNIYVKSAENVNIACYTLCHGSCWGGCYKMEIDASSVKDTVNLICGTCPYLILYANNAKNVRVFAENRHYSLLGVNVDARNATNFHLTCIGETWHYGCTQSGFYIPPNDRTTLNCYGYGCDLVDFYISNGMNSLALSNIDFNGCGFCSDIYHCVRQQWRIYCDGTRSYYNSTELDRGQYCSSPSCGCSEHTDLLTNIFKNIPPQCNDIKPPTMKPIQSSTTSPTKSTTASPSTSNTPSPVSSPTPSPISSFTFSPSIPPSTVILSTSSFTPSTISTLVTSLESTAYEPTTENLANNNSNISMAFIIIGSILIFCGIIVVIVYCIKCRKSKKIPHQKLEDDPDDQGIEEITEIGLQPISLNGPNKIEMNLDDTTNDNQNMTSQLIK